MVKHLSCLMTRFFTRERFGRPQFLAGLLLLAFLAQASWLVHSELTASAAPGASEQARIAAGWRQLHGGTIAGAPYPDLPSSLPMEVSQSEGYDTEYSPLLSLVTAAPLLASPQRLLDPESSSPWRWLLRLPFLACGVFLGASLWYVARRLCGNTGGFLALTLYCFSPSMIQASAVWHTEPEILAAWGSFGAIFTAIAVAHTLYAPREVVLWNWRRILLLAVSLAIAVGSQFSMIVLAPLALFFLLYLAPIRRAAALTIWFAAILLAIRDPFWEKHATLTGTPLATPCRLIGEERVHDILINVFWPMVSLEAPAAGTGGRSRRRGRRRRGRVGCGKAATELHDRPPRVCGSLRRRQDRPGPPSWRALRRS